MVRLPGIFHLARIRTPGPCFQGVGTCIAMQSTRRRSSICCPTSPPKGVSISVAATVTIPACSPLAVRRCSARISRPRSFATRRRWNNRQATASGMPLRARFSCRFRLRVRFCDRCDEPDGSSRSQPGTSGDLAHSPAPGISSVLNHSPLLLSTAPAPPANAARRCLCDRSGQVF